MSSASRIVATIVGIYAGLLGAAHGYYEILQADTVASGVLINAIGAPCQPETASHACLPAMTIIPSLRVTGLLAILFSVAALVWAIVFVQRNHGGLLLIGLSLSMLLVGAGFIPPMTGIIAGLAGIRINTPGAARRSARWLAQLWPWPLVAYILLLLVQALFGDALNTQIQQLAALALPLEFALLLLSVFSAWAYDARAASAAEPGAGQVTKRGEYDPDD